MTVVPVKNDTTVFVSTVFTPANKDHEKIITIAVTNGEPGAEALLTGTASDLARAGHLMIEASLEEEKAELRELVIEGRNRATIEQYLTNDNIPYSGHSEGPSL